MTIRTGWRRFGRIAIGAALLAVLLYAGLLGALWAKQEWLLFRPAPLHADHAFRLDPDVHETWVDVPGARLDVLELRLPNPDGVVFYLHGNSGNLASWFVNTQLYRDLNLDLVMLDYRGFGKSSGRIESEAQLEADVRAVWDTVAPRYAGKRRVILGRSLGSGLAVSLAAELQPDLTVLVTPYSSMVDVAAEHYPWVPSALLRYPLRTDTRIGAIRGPVLLLHGDRDLLIPLVHSERLKAAAPGATLVVIAGAGHPDIHRAPAYNEALRSYLVPKILSPASPRPGMM